MQVGMYTGAASMAAYEKWQEAISQNISEGSLPGYRKTNVNFEGLDGGTSTIGVSANSSATETSSMPNANTSISFNQGAINHTGNDLDFAIQGKGFFQVKQPDGTMAYTRNGQFHIGADRTLQTSAGLKVMGSEGPIKLLDTGGPIAINAEGTITQGDKPVTTIVTYNFTDTSKLQRVGDSLLAPTDTTTKPTKIQNPTVLNSYLESSNVTPMAEMVNLVAVSRAYEASQKIVQTADDNQGKAIEMLGNMS
jgi:flagellar basal-body rod protein FlgF